MISYIIQIIKNPKAIIGFATFLIMKEVQIKLFGSLLDIGITTFP